MKKHFSVLFVLTYSIFFISTLFAFSQSPENFKGNTIFTKIDDILKNPSEFVDKYVSIKGSFSGWQGLNYAPPKTRSDWVVTNNKESAIYCSGSLPFALTPTDPNILGKQVTVLGKVQLSNKKRPYIEVEETSPISEGITQMVSVAQILFDPIGSRGKRVQLLGVLAKGKDAKGMRFYLLADPTGAISLGKLPKLYPKGTILNISGKIGADQDGLPILNEIEIISTN
ncbi:MAG: OB-fold nucleic acid binding domain-containing protein [Candidatus Riflebacteria bacterium]|nr:OB-fold nucleic acid binding domain-containing protein [Candidatus Riflebacteria bacterium]